MPGHVIPSPPARAAGLLAATLCYGLALAGEVDGRVVLPPNFKPAEEKSGAYWRVENGIVRVLPSLRDPRGTMVVVLEGSESKPKPPPVHPAMVLREGGLWPPVLPVIAGSTVDFKNEGRLTHSLSAGGTEGAKFSNLSQGPGVKRSHRFDTPGVYEIRCADVPHIRAVVLALSTSLFSPVDERGGFKIAGAPPGRYSLRVWYAGNYVHGQPIDVPAEGPVTVEVQLLPR